MLILMVSPQPADQMNNLVLSLGEGEVLAHQAKGWIELFPQDGIRHLHTICRSSHQQMKSCPVCLRGIMYKTTPIIWSFVHADEKGERLVQLHSVLFKSSVSTEAPNRGITYVSPHLHA